jgi:glycosyltransferase involved in cell wall biosynthesis
VRILLITPYVPHRDVGHGTATIVSQYVRHMAARHELGIVCFSHEPRELELVRQLEERCSFVKTVPYELSARDRIAARARSVTRATPLVVSLFSSESMRETLRNVFASQRFDLVQIDTTQMGQYVDLVPSGPRTVLLEIDVIMKPLRRRWQQASGWVRRAHYRREWRNMCRYETTLCRRFDLIYTVTEDDRRLLLEHDSMLRVSVFRVGADPELFEIPERERPGNVVLFIGAFMHPPNVDGALWFHRAVLPTIAMRRPDVKIRLVGGSPPASIRALAANPRLELCGGVTGPRSDATASPRADIGTHLRAADVCIVPLRLGGGIKMKLIEMLAAGCPVVTTSVGIEGIDIRHGEHALVADDADAFASEVLRVLEQPELRARLGLAARALAARNHRWEHNLNCVEAELQSLVAERRAAPTLGEVAWRGGPDIRLIEGEHP